MQNQYSPSPPSGELRLCPPVTRQREVFDRLAKLASRCDTGIGHHGGRVGKIAGLIAIELGMPRNKADQIARAAQLHDIGKIGIPDAILRQPGRLTRVEYEETKKHTSAGAKILAGYTFAHGGWPPKSPSITTNIGMAAVTSACAGKRSRWRRGSPIWRIASTRCCTTGRIRTVETSMMF